MVGFGIDPSVTAHVFKTVTYTYKRRLNTCRYTTQSKGKIKQHISLTAPIHRSPDDTWGDKGERLQWLSKTPDHAAYAPVETLFHTFEPRV